MDSLPQICEGATSHFEHPITEYTCISRSDLFNVYKCTLSNGQKVIVKGYTTINWDEPLRLRREATTLEWLKSYNIPQIPQVYDFTINKGIGVLSTTHIEGDQISEEKFGTETLIPSVGNQLSQLHKITDDPPMIGPYGPTGEGVVQDTTRAIEATPYIVEYAQLIDACASVLQDTTPIGGVVHGDIHPSNMLYNSDGSVVGLIDWEYSGLSDIHLDLAKAETRFMLVYRELHQSLGFDIDTVLQSFRDSYGYQESNINTERVTAYTVLFLIRELGLKESFGSGWEDEISTTQSSQTICKNCIETLVADHPQYTRS